MYSEHNPKIDLCKNGIYFGSTKWSKTCREALGRFLEKAGIPFEKPLRSHVFIHEGVKYSAHISTHP